ncbi:Amino acid/polyamine transporter I [Penicillium expansum]|nr:Amino acid/polyamine transporter I [Penicillium expansum]
MKDDSPKSLEAGDRPESPYDDPKAMKGEVTRVHNSSTQRGLSSRHVQFLALGGCIGTGLFVGSGAALSTVGPAPLLMGYIVMSIIGVSTPYLITRFTEPSLGFAIGYNYWYSFAMLLASEVTACGLVIEYWDSPVNVGVWIAIVLLLVLLLNIIAVSWYGEAEFWFASLKIIAILGLIILGIVLFFGGGPNHDLRILLHFSPELITAAAGEAESPRRNIPKASKRFIYRLFAFYVLGSLVIGVTVAYNDKNLLQGVASGGSGAGASPFVVGIQNAGITGLNHVINAAILTSACSSGNSWLFAGSRTLYSLAGEGQAPAIFLRCNKNGVPYNAVLATWAIGLLSFLNLSNSGSTVFYWFTNITTIGGFLAWVIVAVAYLRFRSALDFHGLLKSRPFITPLQPYGAYFVMVFVSLLAITNGYTIFWPGQFTASDFLVSYIVFVIFFVLYFGHKFYYKTPWIVKVSELDIFSGKDEIDRLEEERSNPSHATGLSECGGGLHRVFLVCCYFWNPPIWMVLLLCT